LIRIAQFCLLIITNQTGANASASASANANNSAQFCGEISIES
jgi:hypothetical protein